MVSLGNDGVHEAPKAGRRALIVAELRRGVVLEEFTGVLHGTPYFERTESGDPGDVLRSPRTKPFQVRLAQDL
jgi:hypothetical protein